VFGRGAFGQVLKCFDHKTRDYVALKIVVNTPQMLVQGPAEVAVVSTLNDADPAGGSHIIRMLDTFRFRGHVCAVFEVLGDNLYEYVRRNGFRPLSMPVLRRVGRQMLQALAFTHGHDIVHCDMKPENVLIVPNSVPMSVKVIDYGSACRIGQKHFDYVQSRFYRAPEVILGLAYGPPMDIWSFGCILAELIIGQPLFAGDSEGNQLRLHMEVLGLPPHAIVSMAPRKAVHFASNGRPRKPIGKARPLEKTLKNADPALLDLVVKCLQWDQERRITAEAALEHDFFTRIQPECVVAPSPRIHTWRKSSPPESFQLLLPPLPLPEISAPPSVSPEGVLPKPAKQRREVSPGKRKASPPPAAARRRVSPPPMGLQREISLRQSPFVKGKPQVSGGRPAGAKADPTRRAAESPRRRIGL
jgi:dual specificity tyrosine-phosphorylation-regulated kinase 2/3/4